MSITDWVMPWKWFSMLFDRRFVIKCVLHWCPVFFNAFGTRIKPKKKRKNFFFYFIQLFFNWFISCVLRCYYYYSMAACCGTYSPAHTQPCNFLSFFRFASSIQFIFLSFTLFLSLHFFVDFECDGVFSLFSSSHFIFIQIQIYVTRLDHSFCVWWDGKL